MKEQLTIVKAGGSIVESDQQTNILIESFLGIKGHKILVHGGGKVASELAEKLNVNVEMIDGRRITDDTMIDIVTMTYGGLINKKLVALINAKGSKSIGLTGADGDCIRANKRPIKNGIDYGWVGDVKSVNIPFLDQLLQSNVIPVMAPLTHDGEGNLLNTNADTIASELGVAFSETYYVSVNYLFDFPGVMKDVSDPNSLIKVIDNEKYQNLLADDLINGGMIPKLDNAFAAIEPRDEPRSTTQSLCIKSTQ